MSEVFDLIAFGRKPHWYRCNLPDVQMSVRAHLDENVLFLNSIRVEPGKRGQKLGTIALLNLMLFAVRHRYTLELHPEADDSRDQLRLELWYRRMGFQLRTSAICKNCSKKHYSYA